MPPQSRGSPVRPGKSPLPAPLALHSKSTPNLPTINSLDLERKANAANTKAGIRREEIGSTQVSPVKATSNESRSSLDDFSLDSASTPPSLLQIASSDDEDTDVPSISSHLAPRHHSRSHAHLAPSAFAPPFYNRPPTPLPPSPSLTSLLRPTFSGASSRPNTPDPSSDEGTPTTRTNGTGAHTPNSAASTLFRAAKPIPRASPKVPTYEYYGFTLYLTSSLAFIVYILWSFLPSPFLHQLGIYYFPDRWWALAIPAWTVMLIVYIYVALASYNTGYLTLSMNNVECIVDEAANIAVVDAEGNITRSEGPSWRSLSPDGKSSKRGGGSKSKMGGHSQQSSLGTNSDLQWRTLWNYGTDAVMDIPMGGVCEILYGQDNVLGHQNGAMR
ncbi:Hypothetical protein R9X50_00363100 [Acrodontium crateriforme]|uniref:PIG-P domain-containing protein n=1 Tax=Acrodontium crateriforme TaxID=150365 RepID=A0AAQ3R4D4_9PEZI|nr:Hypothetical protein R9X50_00363100 [Acrodontium crateriforme]